MKTLNKYIQESLDLDNLSWKLDFWFKDNPTDQSHFNTILNTYYNGITKEEIETQINDLQFAIEGLMDFINDTITHLPDDPPTDYLYQFMNILRIVKGNKYNV